MRLSHTCIQRAGGADCIQGLCRLYARRILPFPPSPCRLHDWSGRPGLGPTWTTEQELNLNFEFCDVESEFVRLNTMDFGQGAGVTPFVICAQMVEGDDKEFRGAESLGCATRGTR